MPLDLDESLSIAYQAAAVLERFGALPHLDPALQRQVAVLVGHARAAIDRQSPGGRRITEHEASRVVGDALPVLLTLIRASDDHEIREVALLLGRLLDTIHREARD